MGLIIRRWLGAFAIGPLMLLVSAIDPAIPNVSVFTSGIGTLQNVLYLENGSVSAVVVGGRNVLYQLSTSLELEVNISTGPELDHPSCSPSPGTHCEQERTLMDNDNQVLVQLGPLYAVLACGSLWQGTCSIYSLFMNLTLAVSMDRSRTVNYVASRVSTVAFFGTGNQKATLFAASTYDDRPVKYHPFAVSGRDIDPSRNFMLHSSEERSQSFINMASEPLKKSYRVHYIYGMSHGDFAYFVTVQNSGRSLNTFETRLARVCQKDLTFLSYTEIPVSCEMEKQRFGIATAASADPTSTNGEKVLVIAFGKPYGGQMHTGDPRSGSAVCYFEMGDIVRAFETAVTNCNAAKQTSKLSRLYTANPSSLACTQYTPVEEGEFCTPGANNYIEGQITLNGAPAVYLPERLVTSVTMMRQHETSVAWIGDNTGFLHKYKLIKGQPATFLFSTDLSDGEGTPIERSTAVEPSGMFAYFLTGRKVIRFPVGSCSIYTKCSECMRKLSDPLKCGWCVDKCAHEGECPPKKLELQKCPIFLESVSPTKGPTFGGTQLTLRGENFGSPHHKPNSNVEVTVGDGECKLIHWNDTLVQCRTPPGEAGTMARIVISVNDTEFSSENPFDVMDTKVFETEFHYQVSTFNGISPSYGPMYGGTNIIVHGVNLDSGSSQEVTLGDVTCPIHSVTNTFIECTTIGKEGDSEEGDGEDQPRPAGLSIDGRNVTLELGEGLSQDFTYRPNPSIDGVFPTTTSFRGCVVQVLGKHLDSVSRPRMVTRVRSIKYERQEDVTTECDFKSEALHCRMPSLLNSTVMSQDELLAYSLPIPVQVYFQMDGLRLPQTADGGDSSFDFVYRPAPHFNPFPENGLGVRASEPTLLITGRHFEILKQSDDLNIRIDQIDNACNVTKIIDGAIACVVRTDIFTDDSAHTVEVVFDGQHHPIGSLMAITEKEANNTGTIAGAVVAVFILALFAVGAIFYYKRQAAKKTYPNYFVDFQNGNAENGNRLPGSNNYVQGSEADARQALISSTFQLDDETKAMLEAEKLLFKREFLTLGPVIGQGHFGCVYRGNLELEGKGEIQSVAVKTLHNNSRGGEADGQAFLEEAMIMKDFHHMNVLPLIGLSIDEGGQLMVIIPYMKYGDLLSYIRDERNSPTVKDLITYGIHVAEGMKYLSDTKFVHRDLAARNCMLSEDYIVRVADFGLSRDVYEKDYYSGDNKKTKLPVKWMAPESLEKGIYNHKTDVWAYGVLLWELMTRGVTPYPEVDNWDIVNFLKQGRRMQQPAFCPNMLYDIMLQCWEEDPKKRPSFARLVTDVTSVITTLEKKNRNKRVSLNVTYVNYPRPDMDGAGPSIQGTAEADL